MREKIWRNGMAGVIIGDALGCPVQFESRRQILEEGPVTGMRGYGTYHKPKGTWTDDGSMSLAGLDSLVTCGRFDPDDVMERFIRWEFEGAYTQYGVAFDQGATCMRAVYHYRDNRNAKTCGKTGERANGNGALMRILPFCLYELRMQQKNGKEDSSCLAGVHEAAALTHNHERSNIACGLYFFMIREIVSEKWNTLKEALQAGMDAGAEFYRKKGKNFSSQLSHYDRLADLDVFEKTKERDIRSSGYVVDTLEAALWSLITTDSFKEALLKAVNLGGDTDTVAAITGGLAGLWYGENGILEEWVASIPNISFVEKLCDRAEERF